MNKVWQLGEMCYIYSIGVHIGSLKKKKSNLKLKSYKYKLNNIDQKHNPLFMNMLFINQKSFANKNMIKSWGSPEKILEKRLDSTLPLAMNS